MQLLMTDCTLDGNTAGYRGGAIYGEDNVTLKINNTKLKNNKASDDGEAICSYNDAQPLITNCAWEGSDAGNKNYGDAVYCTDIAKLGNFERKKQSAEFHYFADQSVNTTKYTTGNEDFDYYIANDIVFRQSCFVSGIILKIKGFQIYLYHMYKIMYIFTLLRFQFHQSCCSQNC